DLGTNRLSANLLRPHRPATLAVTRSVIVWRVPLNRVGRRYLLRNRDTHRLTRAVGQRLGPFALRAHDLAKHGKKIQAQHPVGRAARIAGTAFKSSRPRAAGRPLIPSCGGGPGSGLPPSPPDAFEQAGPPNVPFGALAFGSWWAFAAAR